MADWQAQACRSTMVSYTLHVARVRLHGEEANEGGPSRMLGPEGYDPGPRTWGQPKGVDKQVGVQNSWQGHSCSIL